MNWRGQGQEWGINWQCLKFNSIKTPLKGSRLIYCLGQGTWINGVQNNQLHESIWRIFGKYLENIWKIVGNICEKMGHSWKEVGKHDPIRQSQTNLYFN